MTSTAAMAISADSDDRRRRFPPFPPFREFRLVEITLNWLDMSLLSGCTRIASKSAALKSRCLDIRTDGQKELNMTEEPVHEGLFAVLIAVLQCSRSITSWAPLFRNNTYSCPTYKSNVSLEAPLREDSKNAICPANFHYPN